MNHLQYDTKVLWRNKLFSTPRSELHLCWLLFSISKSSIIVDTESNTLHLLPVVCLFYYQAGIRNREVWHVTERGLSQPAFTLIQVSPVDLIPLFICADKVTVISSPEQQHMFDHCLCLVTTKRGNLTAVNKVVVWLFHQSDRRCWYCALQCYLLYHHLK